MTRKLDIRPQVANANRHTERGMRLLEKSIGDDGWIGAVTVAADGETFDGSARVEKTAENGMLDTEPQVFRAEPNRPVVIEGDGSAPLIYKRLDIPTASDPRARRLGIAANRVAQLNLEWEPGVLSELAADGVDLAGLFTDQEWADVAMVPADDNEWGSAFGALPDGDRAPFQQMTFTVSDDQAETIRAALDKAKHLAPFVDTGNENSNGNALARICEAFNG